MNDWEATVHRWAIDLAELAGVVAHPSGTYVRFEGPERSAATDVVLLNRKDAIAALADAALRAAAQSEPPPGHI